MTHKMLLVSDTNPNDTAGGGGCICSPEKQIDCHPPYVIFPGNDMESPLSPHVVACHECLRYALERSEGEALAIGEHHEIQDHFGGTATPAAFADLPAPVIEGTVEDEEDIPEV